jgi:thymidine phosphorylase
MSEPLAPAAGNAVEVASAVDFLTGAYRSQRLEKVTLALAAEMLLVARLARSQAEGLGLARQALVSGAAAERFARMVHGLGGPADFMEHMHDHLPRAPVEHVVAAPQDGYVGSIATRSIGLAVVVLGGGRTRAEDGIDHAVGITRLLPVGAEVRAGEPIAFVHARSQDAAEHAARRILAAYAIEETRPSPRDPILRRISAPSVTA